MRRLKRAYIRRTRNVSILTRPEGRVRPDQPCPIASRKACFNPHPTRRPGATSPSQLSARTVGVSILTRPEGRVRLAVGAYRARQRPVSILTRPEGRVRQFLISARTSLLRVSILTRPEGRVRRHRWVSHRVVRDEFQSSPDPKAGCDIWSAARNTSLEGVFQSSPDPKAGCDHRFPALTHRPTFQSSPDPKAGCDGINSRICLHYTLLDHSCAYCLPYWHQIISTLSWRM